MERLTQTFEENGQKFACLPECKNGCVYGLSRLQSGCRCHNFAKILDRLSVLEDILGDDYDLDHLRKLVTAYDEGRYIIMKEAERQGVSRLVELAEADRDGRVVVLPCKVEDDVYINLLGRTIPLTVISISWLTETPTFKAMNGATMYYIFKSEDVGKTVFLTREAAEEALKGEHND